MISVVIPFYKGNQYIPQLCEILRKNAIALATQCNVEMEVIFVNDSPDIEIVFPQKEDNITVINNKVNCGIQKSRWTGIQHASGEFILLLDQDDLIADDCIAYQYKAIQDCDFVVSNGYMTDSSGDSICLYKNEIEQRKVLNIKFYYRCSNPIISPGQVLIRKECIPSIWGNINMRYHGADDLFLWLLLLSDKHCKGTINPQKLYTHVFTGSNTSLNLELMEKSNLEVLEIMKDKMSIFNRFCFYRRTEYYAHLRDSIGYKISYADVALMRFCYKRRIGRT